MRNRLGSIVLGIALAVALGATAAADPPDHAPAHGWRKKQDRPRHGHYVGYSGSRWDDDYGVGAGRCNRDAVGAIVGGVIGGAVGSTIGRGDGRTVAIIAGTILGAVVGAEIGRDMDREDRACMGHALELVRDGREVRWSQPSLGITYLMTPTGAWRHRDQPCRNFRIVEVRGSQRRIATGHACRVDDGEWEIVRQGRS